MLNFLHHGFFELFAFGCFYPAFVRCRKQDNLPEEKRSPGGNTPKEKTKGDLFLSGVCFAHVGVDIRNNTEDFSVTGIFSAASAYL